MTSFALTMNIKSVWSGDPSNIPLFTRVQADASSGQPAGHPTTIFTAAGTWKVFREMIHDIK